MEIGWSEITILLAAAAISIFAYVKWIFGFWERKNVPHIKPSFPMGNLELPWATKKGIHGIMMDIYNDFKSKGYKYGGMFFTLEPMFVPVDLDLLKNIMIKDFQHFVDRGAYINEKDDPVSAHLFAIEGQKWRSLRTKLSPTFTSGKMKGMFQMVVDCGDQLEKQVVKLWQKNEPVNIKEVGALFTTNVIGTCAFGLDCNCFENPNNDFRKYGKKLFDGGFFILLRFMMTQSFPNICRKFGILATPKDIGDFYMDVTKNIVDQREKNNIHRNDFVNLLLDIKNGAKTKEESLTINEIAAQAFVFFLAGFETSSSTMTFAFYEMAKSQDVQDKVREEIHRVLEKHNGKITYDAVMEMTYMQQVFDETLRKYPIVATLNRICTKDYKIPNEDLVLKKGTKLLISLQGIQNDPEYFPNPEKFDPDRFTPENKAKLHPCVYMPFGEGPRICIGMRFGVMQAKIGMAIMLKDYKYSISPKMPKMELYSKSPLLQPIGDVLLNIEKVN